MVGQQEKYLVYLGKIINTISDCLDESKIAQSANIKQRIKEVELIVPVVGGFSAGKSSAINQFLGENILGVGLTPETALATELHYSQENFFEAIRKNGEVERYEISQTNEMGWDAKECQFLKLYLNNPKLKEIEPLVLVDMPGFDAPIEHHNQAIFAYLSKGVHFIVLISIEDGTIHKSILREIENIMEIGKSFAFCLSKTNLRSKLDVDVILKEVESQLWTYFDYEENVVLLHKESGDDLKNILLGIDPNSLIFKLFSDELKLQNREIQSEINMQISSLKLNVKEAKEAIEALQDSLNRLLGDKDKKILQIRQKYASQNLDNIISKIHTELFSQTDTLAQLMIKNPEAFSSEINSVIRQVLVAELQDRIVSINSGIIEEIKVDLSGLDEMRLDTQWIDVLADKMQGLLMGSLTSSITKENRLKTLLPSVLLPMTKFIPRIGTVPSTILNPILGVAVSLLPGLIDIFRSKSKESVMKEKAIEYYQQSILPSIKSSVRVSLKNAFSEYVEESMSVIYREFEEQIKQKQEQLKAIQQEKQQQQGQIEQKIQWLTSKRNEIQLLAEKFLYQ